MATASSSNGPPAAADDDAVMSSPVNKVKMSRTVDAVDVKPPPLEDEEQGRRQEGAGNVGALPSEEETSTPASEGGGGGGGGGDATETIAQGIASVLGPVVRIFETRVDDVLKSQSSLQSSVDRLTRELDKLLEDTPLPLGAQHAAKLSGIRKRVGSLTETLRIIQGRINSMDRMLSKEKSVGSLH